MVKRIVVCRKYLIFVSIFFGLTACATPIQKNINFALAKGFKQFDILGKNFTHTVFLNQENSGKTWHVYIEGDGQPWVDNQFIARDPTTVEPLMLRLMTQDNAPAIYLARPCYFRIIKDKSCQPLLWTHRRYSEEVVSSMEAALRKLIETHHIQSLVLVGHSGGGTLAMLLAEKISETKVVVTLAGNLDVDAWADQHEYTRLHGSLNPAQQKPLPAVIRQYHYLGKHDKNITASMVVPVVNKQHNAELFLLDDYNHDCCWEKDWPDFLAEW